MPDCLSWSKWKAEKTVVEQAFSRPVFCPLWILFSCMRAEFIVFRPAALCVSSCQGYFLWTGSCSAWHSQALTFLGKCKPFARLWCSLSSTGKQQLLCSFLSKCWLSLSSLSFILDKGDLGSQWRDFSGGVSVLHSTSVICRTEKDFTCLLQVGFQHQKKEITVFWLECSASRLYFVLHNLEGYEANWKSALCCRGRSWAPSFLLERPF